jgi:hypothetical protein
MNRSLRFCLASAAIGGIATFALVPVARAQWLAPWGASPGEIERSLEAQGYGLIAPLLRRPGVYLADVSAGPAGYQRLVIDARNGQILERFVAPGRIWAPALAGRQEEFGEPQLGGVGPPVSPAMPYDKSTYGSPENLRVPAAGPYVHGNAPAGAKVIAKGSPAERKAMSAKLASSPPLPPPAPREVARQDGSDLPASEPAKAPESSPQKIDSRPVEVENAPPPAAPSTQTSPAEGSDKSKVSIVPPSAFE